MAQVLGSSQSRSLGGNIRLAVLVSNQVINNRYEYTLVMPPSTTKSVPLTKLLSSLARKTTA